MSSSALIQSTTDCSTYNSFYNDGTTIAPYDVGSYERASSYELVDLENDKVVRFQEKPDEPGWFIQWLQSRRDVHAFTFEDPWFDIGTPESYIEAIAWYLDGDNEVHRGATIENADLRGNVHVMSGAEVVDTTLDNVVVFPDAMITDCEIRNSLIDEKTEIDSLDLSGAVIGAHTQLNGY